MVIANLASHPVPNQLMHETIFRQIRQTKVRLLPYFSPLEATVEFPRSLVFQLLPMRCRRMEPTFLKRTLVGPGVLVLRHRQ